MHSGGGGGGVFVKNKNSHLMFLCVDAICNIFGKKKKKNCLGEGEGGGGGGDASILRLRHFLSSSCHFNGKMKCLQGLKAFMSSIEIKFI